ncbi:MAG: hypothetical protein JRI47_03590 [Deltaproteobacteria bacterium]|nr:hypothetical protein [Deltaproteobacteria bacterium]
MDLKSRIKTLFKEAELYKSQGLLMEALEKYGLVAELIRDDKKLGGRQYLLDALSKKISVVERQAQEFGQTSRSPELSTKVQDLIKQLFSFSQDDDEEVAELEGTIALAKFGQFERAIVEFNRLLKRDSLRVVAAKNAIRCYLATTDFDGALNQFEQWRSSVDFSSNELEQVRRFLQEVLNKKGVEETRLPVMESTGVVEDETPGEEFLDIVSIGLTLARGPRKGKFVELDVNFQRMDTISLMISSEDKDLVENLQVGVKLDNVEFSSPFAVFTGSGVVSARSKIESGPKQGDYMLDIKISSG